VNDEQPSLVGLSTTSGPSLHDCTVYVQTNIQSNQAPPHGKKQSTSTLHLPQINIFFGITIGFGLRYMTETFSTENTVSIGCSANKRAQLPTALPDKVPVMTSTALAYLRQNGVDAFYKAYGSHFIIGFRMGGYLNFGYRIQANQRVSRQEISGDLSLNLVLAFVRAGGGFAESGKGRSVNIERFVRTNTDLPPDACARVGVGSQTFNPSDAEACVAAWLNLPGNAATAAYAVPW